MGEGEDELFGVDFITLISAVQLLGQAPLDGDQRAALFEVLIDAPRWFRADGAAAISIRNLGPEVTDGGRTGNRLRVAMDIEPDQTGDTGVDPGVWKLDLIVDSTAGELIGMHEYEVGEEEPEVTTIRDLKVIPAAGPTAPSTAPQSNEQLPDR